MRQPWGLCVLLCLWGYPRETSAVANIDVLQPVVRRSPVQSNDDDFFGYSVVLHQLNVPGSFEDALNQTRIIVGAPRGTYPGGLMSLPDNGMAENQTGLIYNCPIQPGDCDGLFGNGAGNDLRLFDPEPDTDTMDGMITIAEQKRDQFLGGTMYSTGDYFLVCAQRWVQEPLGTANADNSRAYGRCFVSDRSLSGFALVRPCQSSSLSNSRDGATHCSAGVGAVLYENSAGPGLILGAPGFESAIGQLYSYGLNTTDGSLIEPFVQAVPNSGPGIDYTYLGYTVITGRIRSRENLDLVASRPRNDGKTYMGQVQLFSLEDVTNFTGQTVDGNQTGEYFGFSLATADLSGDGLEELLVGAPMYTIPADPRLGRSAEPEIGRVYVFENLNGVLSDTPVVLEGDRVAFSRFGHSVVNIGDVNDDGYEDVAIGAPFMDLGDPNANGTVFIYYGSGSGVINTIPQQVIRASDVVDTVEGLDELKTFGYSLASGVDVDANEYYDLAIGSISSQTVVVFRVLSVARLDVNFTSLVDEVDVVNRNCNDSTFACFDVSVCANYTGRGLDGELELLLRMSERLSATGNEQRLQFGSDPDEPYEQPFVFSDSGVKSCDVITVYVRNTDIRELTPFALNISFRSLPRELQTIDGNQALSDLTLTPLLLASGDAFLNIDLSTRCGDDQICHSDLALGLEDVTFVGSNNVKLLQNELVADEAVFVNVTLEYNNTAEDAFGSQLDFTLPEGILRHRRVISEGSSIVCMLLNSTRGEYTCPLMSPLRKESGTSRITLQWFVEDLTGDEGSFDISIEISIPPNTMNLENTTDLANNVVIVPIVIVAEADLVVSIGLSPDTISYAEVAPSDPPGGLLPAAGLGSRSDLTFSVSTRGPSVVQEIQLDIFLPVNSDETGQFYYFYPFALSITPVPSEFGAITCDRSNINPDRRIQSSPMNRKRRSVRLVMRREALNRVRRQDDEALIRTCDSGPCVIRCRITNPVINAEFVVQIEGYADNRFFSNQNGTITYNLVPSATVSIQGGDTRERNDADNMDQATLTVGPPTPTVIPDGGGDGVEIWVYIVSIVGALIIVFIIIVCLYFFGFFRRKKHELEKKEAEGDFEVPAELAGGVVGGTAVGVAVGDEEKEGFEDEVEKERLDDEMERVATPSPPPADDKEKSPEPVPAVEEAGVETGGGAEDLAGGGAEDLAGGGAPGEVAVEMEPANVDVEFGETDFGYHGDIGGNDDFETEL